MDSFHLFRICLSHPFDYNEESTSDSPRAFHGKALPVRGHQCSTARRFEYNIQSQTAGYKVIEGV